MGKTLGSEPSKYQQEEKSREIPPVAASEKGRAQTVCRDMYGVVGDIQSLARAVRKQKVRRTEWEVRREKVKAL